MNQIADQKFLELILEKFWIFFLILVWNISWKGIALWKSARNGQKKWFLALLILNTLGILEIIYILAFSKKKKA